MNELEKRLGGEPASGQWPELRRKTVESADRSRLLEITYERHDSPFGPLLVVAGESGILRIALAPEPEPEVLDDLARRVSPRIGRTGREVTSEARRQLDRYFAGVLRSFDLPLDWQLTRAFRREVLRQTAAIPYGETASYTEVALDAGNPRAVRAAGSALATNPLPILVPCHRVLRSDGKVGAYLGGTEMKSALLAMEKEAAGTDQIRSA